MGKPERVPVRGMTLGELAGARITPAPAKKAGHPHKNLGKYLHKPKAR